MVDKRKTEKAGYQPTKLEGADDTSPAELTPPSGISPLVDGPTGGDDGDAGDAGD